MDKKIEFLVIDNDGYNVGLCENFNSHYLWFHEADEAIMIAKIWEAWLYEQPPAKDGE